MRLLIFTLIFFPLLAWGQDDSTIPYFQNEKFVSYTFGFPLNVKNFKKNYGDFLTIVKTPIENTYDKSVIDTVYTFSSEKTKIEIYHSRERDILQSAHIVTNKIKLTKNIKIGMSESEVGKNLKIKIISDRIRVGDLEQNSVFEFTFSKGKLIIIDYSGYIE
jgi:hypothetical protein